MGMDIAGFRPSSERGECFYNSMRWWHPLAHYITCFGPQEVVSKCLHWHFNDHDGLGSHDSQRLAAALQDLIDSGHTKRIEEEIRPEGFCFSVENVQRFVNFLRDCGGFSID